MNASNVLKYGNRTVMDVLDSLPFDNWETEGVCGIWSVKNIVAHLTSYEWVLADILRELEAGGPTPHLDAYRLTGMVFNDEQVDARKDMSAAETLAEYQAARTRTSWPWRPFYRLNAIGKRGTCHGTVSNTPWMTISSTPSTATNENTSLRSMSIETC